MPCHAVGGQELHLKAQCDRRCERIVPDVPPTLRIVERIEVVGGVPGHIDMDLIETQ